MNINVDVALEPKFAEGARFELKYSGLSDFFGGLEKRIGAPDPNVEEAVEKEHVDAADSQIEFTTSNYKVTTTPKIEYEFITQPEPSQMWPREEEWTDAPGRSRRRPLALEELDRLMAEQNKRLEEISEPLLTQIEAIGGRLYTGPM